MKYKFVKKGTEISSENISGLMDFGQVMDKAAGMGMGAAPLSKGALGVKTLSLTKVITIASITVSAAVYIAVENFTNDSPEQQIEQPMEVEQPDLTEMVMPDSTQIEEVGSVDEATKEDLTVTKEREKTNNIEKARPEATLKSNRKSGGDYLLSKEDVMIKAEPMGGFPAFYDLIDKELTYPESRRDLQTEGFVRVYFVVDKEGKPGKFKIVRSLGDAFDEEALRVMNKIPDWIPATHNGQPVSSHMSIRLRFRLEKKD